MAAKDIDVVEVWQGSRRVVTMAVKDTDGVVIPSASMTTIKLTLKNLATGTVINSRNEQSVFNANGGTYHATSGLLTIILAAADNTVTGSNSVERHAAVIEFTYATGAKADAFPFYVDVTRIPA